MGHQQLIQKKIYNSEKGFLIQFSSSKNKWGAGVYFAENSSYSGRKYSHVISPLSEDNQSEDLYQLFLAEVILGDIYYSECQDRTLRLAPVVPCKIPWKNDGFEDERYDSVCGFDHGSKVYIVYENNRAYPAYLITYKRGKDEKKKKK